MVILIEGLIAVTLFTIIAIPATIRHPLTALSDYPPAIVKRCVELGIYPERERRFSTMDLIRKATAVIVFIIVFAFIIKKFNKAETFLEGFRISYILWLIIAWYDALIVDCLFFCHSKKSPDTRNRRYEGISGLRFSHKAVTDRFYHRSSGMRTGWTCGNDNLKKHICAFLVSVFCFDS